MQLASILSDLTSLQVCDPTAALNLVSIRASSTPQTQNQAQGPGTAQIPTKATGAQHNPHQSQNQETDADMQRAIDLLDLHENVKMRHVSRQSGGGGEDEGLLRARRDVDHVARSLGMGMAIGEEKKKGRGST